MKISELHVNDVATYAFNSFIAKGSSRQTARLLFRALDLNTEHSQSITCLVQFIAETKNPVPLKAFLAVPILEYQSRYTGNMNEYDLKYYTGVHMLCLHHWGFATHKNTGDMAKMGDFQNPDLFIIDETKYQNFLSQVLEQVDTLQHMLSIAHTYVGVVGDVLIHKSGGNDFKFDEFFHRDRFSITNEYTAWLALSESTLPKPLKPN